MTKIPCGGFKLDENFFGMNENDELSLVGGSEDELKNAVLCSSSGKVRWQSYPYLVTVNATSNFSKVTCDVPFMELAALMAEGIPIMAIVVIKGGGSVPTSVLFDVVHRQIVFPYDPVADKKLIYNEDDSFSGLVG